MTPPARLLRLHRRTLVNVLVVGGDQAMRLAVARAFHRESHLCRGPLIHLDVRRDQWRLRSALEAWTTASGADGRPDPVRAAETGTLFLDSVERLSPRMQELLLAFAGRLGASWDDEPAWVGRLVAGADAGLANHVAEGRFSAALYDLLDKVRVDLPPRLRGAA